MAIASWPRRLQDATIARVGLARTGASMRCADVLAFQLAHARAKDAVNSALDVEAVRAQLSDVPAVAVPSLARDRDTFLRRPDLGRVPDLSGCQLPDGPFDMVFVIADGLSASGINEAGAPLALACLSLLSDFKIAPIILGLQARVAFGDIIGQQLDASLAVVIIGERPGLSIPNSIGIYMTWGPARGCPDSQRNCISNIHPNGLTRTRAAHKLNWLVRQSFQRRLSGVNLKEAAEDNPTNYIE